MNRLSNAFMDNLSDVNPRSSCLVYAQGNEVFYRCKYRPTLSISSKTTLSENMIIYTGDDSQVCYYLKSYGYIHIYPNSTLNIEKTQYSLDNSTGMNRKETKMKLEKGKIFFGINNYADNCKLVVNTDTTLCSVKKADFFIECDGGLNTNVTCISGEVFYRPNSQVLNPKGELSSYTPSVEKFLSDKSRLFANQMVDISSEQCALFDKLIKKIQQSSVIISFDIESIIKKTLISVADMDDEKKFKAPFHEYKNDNEFTNTAYIEIISHKVGAFFDNKMLESNVKYILLTTEGTHTYGVKNKQEQISLKSNEKKVIVIK